MWNAGRGFMAIWSDVAPGDSDFYHEWLLKEHFPERVGVPGFIAARVFRRSTGQESQFFIIYETEAPEVLASPAYVARLNNPTAMTQKVMPKLKNFVRGAGRVVQSSGVCGGGAAKVMRFEEAQALLGDANARTALFEKINGMDRVLAVRLFEVDTAATTIQTEEKKIRTSREEIYNQLLVIEAADVDAFEAVSELLQATLFSRQSSPPPYDQSYQFITELQGRSLN
jgi:ribosomal 30S subunit maturation factor RimM